VVLMFPRPFLTVGAESSVTTDQALPVARSDRAVPGARYPGSAPGCPASVLLLLADRSWSCHAFPERSKRLPSPRLIVMTGTHQFRAGRVLAAGERAQLPLVPLEQGAKFSPLADLVQMTLAKSPGSVLIAAPGETACLPGADADLTKFFTVQFLPSVTLAPSGTYARSPASREIAAAGPALQRTERFSGLLLLQVAVAKTMPFVTATAAGEGTTSHRHCSRNSPASSMLVVRRAGGRAFRMPRP
jgi:hypothetical protein